LKAADEWDRREAGNLRIDHVAHCGQSAAGSFLLGLSTVDIASNRREGWLVINGTQQSARCVLDAIRRCLPFGCARSVPTMTARSSTACCWITAAGTGARYHARSG
jgi:hypothetical protein